MVSLSALVGSAALRKFGGFLWKNKRRKRITTVIVALVVVLLGKIGISPDIAAMIGEVVAELLLESVSE